MFKLIEENLTLLALIGTVIAQVYSAAKVITQNEHTIKTLLDFKKDYDEHIKEFNKLAQDVSFLKGRSEHD